VDATLAICHGDVESEQKSSVQVEHVIGSGDSSSMCPAVMYVSALSQAKLEPAIVRDKNR
jgi:hypothetical protein